MRVILQQLHSALKLEKSVISKIQKLVFCYFKNGKKSIFAPENVENNKKAIFGLFSGAKINFLPFLKMQIMCFCTFEITLFSNFRALCNGRGQESCM